MSTAFELAPPPVTVNGRTAVPVDLSAVRAHLVFDGATRSARAVATMDFVVGPTPGCPVFDLRQTITGATLDGVPIDAARILTLDLGGGPGAELRVLDQVLAAGSRHTLELTYRVGLPAAPPGGSHPPALEWGEGPRLTLTFGFTDLAPARYLEAWVPANLIWDQYAIELEVTVAGTAVEHRMITNGAVTAVGPNHWRATFPDRSTALSPMLEVRAVDTLARVTATVVLPVSRRAVTVEVLRPLAATGIDLPAALGDLCRYLAENERDVGEYAHGDRFTAFLVRGGMEYDGGCTAVPSTLRHEVFHSWWGRGVRPAGQPDGWWDEGWTVYHDNGATGARPFDPSEPPVTLSTRAAYSRVTPSDAYTAGERFFAGIAAVTGAEALVGWMGEFYRGHRDRPVTTAELEAHLVARSGRTDLVDAFHRWVYGFAAPAPPSDLRFAAAPPGEALWVRHADDGGTVHQHPRAGRDNVLHARVRNHGPGVARHFVVTFRVRLPGGGALTWPAAFLPATTAAAGFDLRPGATAVVRARWPAASVPAVGARCRLLAAAIAVRDHPRPGTCPGAAGDLARRDVTVRAGPPGLPPSPTDP